MAQVPNTSLTPIQQKLLSAWEEHMRCEFETHDVDGTMATMAEKAHID